MHFTESLVQTVVERLSRPGDLVLDPFAGFGTTLLVAERLGRRVLGVELMPERAAHARSRLVDPTTVVEGDAGRLSALLDEQRAGPVDLVLTSPPYRTLNDHPDDPLQAYEREDGDYASYLRDIGAVFTDVARALSPEGRVVVNAANITHRGVLTPLAWDLARVIGRHLTLVQECYLAWDSLPPDITGDYLLVFAASRR